MFFKKLPTFPCQEWGFISTKTPKLYLSPEKVVVEPWRGQHHVYGVFMLPNDYLHDHLITITLPGEPTYCGVLLNAGESYNGIRAKPGHYLIKGYLQTRITIGLIAKGKVSQLKQSKNWKLGYAKE
jgi:hypothetical protein